MFISLGNLLIHSLIVYRPRQQLSIWNYSAIWDNTEHSAVLSRLRHHAELLGSVVLQHKVPLTRAVNRLIGCELASLMQDASSEGSYLLPSALAV